MIYKLSENMVSDLYYLLMNYCFAGALFLCLWVLLRTWWNFSEIFHVIAPWCIWVLRKSKSGSMRLKTWKYSQYWIFEIGNIRFRICRKLNFIQDITQTMFFILHGSLGCPEKAIRWFKIRNIFTWNQSVRISP